MIDLNKLQFHPMNLEGLNTLMEWAREEGWNPGLHDAEVFWATDPEGFYGCYSEGKLIGGGSIVSYGGAFGFMGFFIVKPQYRSCGVGRKLWHKRRDTLLSRLKQGAAIGMDGVVAMQPFYEKGGFEIAFRDERHEKTGEPFEVDEKISSIVEDDMESVLAYDKKCFGFARPQFLEPWLKMPGAKTFKYLDNGKIKGFAVVRKVNTGFKICPLFADDGLVAEELYKACLNAVIGEPLYIDIPVVNPAAMALIQKFQTKYVFECARMYYGKAPEMKIEQVFGLTTFELG